MKAKLTDNQKSIIENLKEEFLRINESANVKGNLINIAELLGLKQQSKDLIEEVRIFNDIEVNKRKEQCISDYYKIVDDIKALGLFCNIFTNHNDRTLYLVITYKNNDLEENSIYAKYLPHSTDSIWINYSYSEEISFQLPDKTGYQHKKVGVKISIDNYCFKTIEVCVGSDNFKQRILKYIK